MEGFWRWGNIFSFWSLIKCSLEYRFKKVIFGCEEINVMVVFVVMKRNLYVFVIRGKGWGEKWRRVEKWCVLSFRVEW